MREQVAANVGHHALGCAHHDLRIAQGRQHARGVDGGRKENLLGEQLLPPVVRPLTMGRTMYVPARLAMAAIEASTPTASSENLAWPM